MANLTVIMAYSGGQATFDRHLHLWEGLGNPILVCCPSDAPVRTTHRRFLSGPNGHCGYTAIIRWKNVISHLLLEAATTQVDHFFIFEYDSFCLDRGCLAAEAQTKGFRGILAANSLPKFTAPFYAIPPWSVNARSLFVMAKSVSRKDIHEDGADDRLLSAWAHLAGIQVLNHDRPGFAMNTIEPCHYPALKTALDNGAVWIHGVKDAATLAFIKENSK